MSTNLKSNLKVNCETTKIREQSAKNLSSKSRVLLEETERNPNTKSRKPRPHIQDTNRIYSLKNSVRLECETKRRRHFTHVDFQ